MEGCEHPPEHKEAAVEEDAPAPPCEAWHRNGQWGDGSLLRQLCPPKPSLLPDPPHPPRHWPSTPTLGLLKALHGVRGPKVTVAARCKTYRATLAQSRVPLGGGPPGTPGRRGAGASGGKRRCRYLREDTLTSVPVGCRPAAPRRSSPLLAGKQLTRGGCQRCWLLDPAAATCSLTCKPGQAYANGWGRAPGAGARGNGGGGRSPASKFRPPPRLLHHHLPASICLPSSSSSIHKIRAALPSTVVCNGQPAALLGLPAGPQACRPAGTPARTPAPCPWVPAPSRALAPAALPKA